MERMKAPAIPEILPPVLNDDQLVRILKTVEGKSDFPCRRDAAVLRLLIDTGMRRAELAGMALADLDLDQSVAHVVGKGRRPRACPFGRKTAQALDRYLRVRATHRMADAPALWIGRGGVMTESGVYQVVRDR